MRSVRNVLWISAFSLIFMAFPAVSRATVPAEEPAPPAHTPTDDKDPVVLTVGPRQVRASELEKRIDGLPPQLKAYYKGQGKRKFVDELIRIELLNGEAIRRKLDAVPEVKTQLDMARSSILAAAAMQALEKEIAVTDAEAQDYFTKHAAELEEIRVRHILVRSRASVPPPAPGTSAPTPEQARAQAQALRQQILEGADFAQTAQKHSDDAATAAHGGDVGFIKRGMNVPPFEQAAFALSPGQVSDVVETPYGFHIIKVESKRTFAELRAQVVARVQQDKAKEKLAEMTHQLNPVVNENYFQAAHGAHASEPIPSFEMEVRPKTKAPASGAPSPKGDKP